MNIHVQLKSPVGDMLGFPNNHGSAEVDVSVNPGTSLRGLFDQLASNYTGCRRLADPKDNILADILIIKDGTVVISTELDQVGLQDQSIITLFTQYKGG